MTPPCTICVAVDAIANVDDHLHTFQVALLIKTMITPTAQRNIMSHALLVPSASCLCPAVCFHADSLLTLRDPMTGAATPRRIADAQPGDHIMVGHVKHVTRRRCRKAAIYSGTQRAWPDDRVLPPLCRSKHGAAMCMFCVLKTPNTAPSSAAPLQVVNEDGALAWSAVIVLPTFKLAEELPAAAYLRMTTAAGHVSGQGPRMYLQCQQLVHDTEAGTLRLCSKGTGPGQSQPSHVASGGPVAEAQQAAHA